MRHHPTANTICVDQLLRIGRYRRLAVCAALLLSLGLFQPAMAAKCLFISSYHQGYAWSDGVERGLRAGLSTQCEVKQFDMDTKRHKSADSIRQKALEAKQLIESWKPDVVITADDNAAKYLIKPFYKNHAIPFVFCGVNWTVKEYGFPYANVTGMIEVAPIEPIFDKAQAYAQTYQRGFYLGANTLTERKNLERFRTAATRRQVTLDHRFVDSASEWLSAFSDAQRYDFVILGSNSGINDWDETKVIADIKQTSKRLSLTNHGWMMPYAMLGLTKIPEEQGEWAAKTAIYILQGVTPTRIPIAPNRKWDIWLNPSLLEAAAIELPDNIMQKGKKVY